MAVQPGILAEQSAIFRPRDRQRGLVRWTICPVVRDRVRGGSGFVRRAWQPGEVVAAGNLGAMHGRATISARTALCRGSAAVASDAVVRCGILSDLSRERTDPEGAV